MLKWELERNTESRGTAVASSTARSREHSCSSPWTPTCSCTIAAKVCPGPSGGGEGGGGEGGGGEGGGGEGGGGEGGGGEGGGEGGGCEGGGGEGGGGEGGWAF